MMEYHTITTERTVLPVGEVIFCERATKIGIDDEAAGAFITITQDYGDMKHTITINPEEWVHVSTAVSEAIAEIRRLEGK